MFLTVEQYICRENMKIAVMHMIHTLSVIQSFGEIATVVVFTHKITHRVLHTVTILTLPYFSLQCHDDQ